MSEENVEAHVVEREQGKVLVHIGSQMISSSSRTSARLETSIGKSASSPYTGTAIVASHAIRRTTHGVARHRRSWGEVPTLPKQEGIAWGSRSSLIVSKAQGCGKPVRIAFPARSSRLLERWSSRNRLDAHSTYAVAFHGGMGYDRSIAYVDCCQSQGASTGHGVHHGHSVFAATCWIKAR